ncbi:DNA-binding protein [Methylicorpusculum oleiharenae]|uniref:DNA-binding protein n=1 Tax=Methylicorpusculum oleiharenae TaxID=1338687 RepID=UPI001358887C|nr:DNA-binding protein [Methylicorpusculum oleiharenae]MCD2453362.1 DNA-binding protein [Methylicorpusculum oleiharenae]
MSSPRLTEEAIHATCADIASQGERPTVLNVYERLGRGSLTTITKYVNSWKDSGEAQVFKAEELPAVVKLPNELIKEGEDLLKRMWTVAKNLTDAELDIQREALKKAEQANQKRVEEAFAFSEAQSLKIERMENAFAISKEEFLEEETAHKQTVGKLKEVEISNVALTKDNDRYRDEIESLKKQVAELAESLKAAGEDKKRQQDQHEAVLKQKDQEIRAFDVQVHTVQSTLNSTITTNEELKIKVAAAEVELSKCNVELEKLTVRHETSAAELKSAKAELIAANKIASDAEKKVSNLEGQLEVYKTLDKGG